MADETSLPPLRTLPPSRRAGTFSALFAAESAAESSAGSWWTLSKFFSPAGRNEPTLQTVKC